MARWKEEDFSKALEAAAMAFDRAEVERLSDELLRHLRSRKDAYPEGFASKDLSTLRRKCHFDLMVQVADAFLRAGQSAPAVRRQYAQALLDLGNVSGALSVLQALLSSPNVSAADRSEAKGLVGRAYKQIYVDAGDPTVPLNRDHLLRAVDVYKSVYDSDPSTYLWQGINAASLLHRARADGVDSGSRPEPAEIARQVLAEVEEKTRRGASTTRHLATAAEASIVLGEHERAACYLHGYVASPDTDAFDLAGTLRQFEQVLKLDRDEAKEVVLLDLLRAHLLEKGGGVLVADPRAIYRWTREADARAGELQALLGPDRPVPHSWLLKSLRRAQGVARIWRGGEGAGTGFLVPGELLSAKWKDHQVLCTNNHVLSRSPMLPMTLLPEEASITFDALHENGAATPSYEVKEILYESPIRELDVTCCRLSRTVAGVEPFDAAKAMPVKARDERVYVIGHPRGAELSFSIHDNKLLDLNSSRIHYRSPTEPGSSGSPLFNDRWELIGIHHAGGKAMRRLDEPAEIYEANEGIPLPSIQKDISAKI